MDSNICSVRLCRRSAVGNSPITCQRLCELHMESDLAKVDKSASHVVERIRNFKKYTDPLQLMRQRLTSDLQLLDETFTELRTTLDKCQKDLVGVITKQHDQLVESLSVLADLEDFERELREARDQNDMRQAFIISESMERSLENLQFDSKLVCMDEETQKVSIAAYPDVISRVRDLRACVDLEMHFLGNSLEFLDVGSTKQEDEKIVTTEEKLDIHGEAVCFTRCNNTRGFVIDYSDGIIRAQSIQEVHAGAELPQPSVFVVVKCRAPISSEGASASERVVFRIRLICSNPQLSSTIVSSWDEDEKILDLHCDDSRQQLYVAQKRAVTVTDLSGALQSTLTLESISSDIKKMHCINGDAENQYILTESAAGILVIYAVSKATGEVQQRLPVPDTCSLLMNTRIRLAVRGRMLNLSDIFHVFTICSITGQHVYSESLDKINSAILEEDIDASVEIRDEARLLCAVQYLPRVSTLSAATISRYAQTLLLSRSPSHCVWLDLEDGEIYLRSLKF